MILYLHFILNISADLFGSLANLQPNYHFKMFIRIQAQDRNPLETSMVTKLV